MHPIHIHGIIPVHITDKVIGHYEAKGKLDIVTEMRDLHLLQHNALANRKQEQKTAFKAHRQGLLPDGQVVKVYSASNKTDLAKATLKRDSNTRNADVTINEAYDGSALTYQFLKDIFHRNSVDNHHFPLNSFAHFGRNYNNAYWDGREMVYGDGDGKLFNRFTIDIDIPAHEQAHALTDNEAGKALNPKGKGTGIDYEGEAGGINESYSDQFGIMVKQWQKKESADKSNWLIGEHLLVPKKGKTFALRSMLNPGTAYINHPALGTDTQIAHYADYLLRQQQGGPIDPHDGSGVVNKAFAIAAQTYGGNAWDVMGQVFFNALPNVVPNETFNGLAAKTLAVVQTQYKDEPKIKNALLKGWTSVGVLK